MSRSSNARSLGAFPAAPQATTSHGAVAAAGVANRDVECAANADYAACKASRIVAGMWIGEGDGIREGSSTE